MNKIFYFWIILTVVVFIGSMVMAYMEKDGWGAFLFVAIILAQGIEINIDEKQNHE